MARGLTRLALLIPILGMGGWGCDQDDDVVYDCDRDPPLSYLNWGKGFLDTHCTGCHSPLVPEAQRNGAPDGVDLDTYAKVLIYGARIDERAFALEEPMPPGGGPTEDELMRLDEWLQCGVFPDQDLKAGGR